MGLAGSSKALKPLSEGQRPSAKCRGGLTHPGSNLQGTGTGLGPWAWDVGKEPVLVLFVVIPALAWCL
jgi:hypothetical protein